MAHQQDLGTSAALGAGAGGSIQTIRSSHHPISCPTHSPCGRNPYLILQQQKENPSVVPSVA